MGPMFPIFPDASRPRKRGPKFCRLLREAIEFHIETMREDGLAVPEPSSSAEYVEVAMA